MTVSGANCLHDKLSLGAWLERGAWPLSMESLCLVHRRCWMLLDSGISLPDACVLEQRLPLPGVEACSSLGGPGKQLPLCGLPCTPSSWVSRACRWRPVAWVASEEGPTSRTS